jgi:alpha-D-xyloside xylohydrolase
MENRIENSFSMYETKEYSEGSVSSCPCSGPGVDRRQFIQMLGGLGAATLLMPRQATGASREAGDLNGCCSQEQNGRVVLQRDDTTVVLEPYAPNIIRVTLSTGKDWTLAPPGYGITASPSAEGWNYQRTTGTDIYASPQVVVTIPQSRLKAMPASQLAIADFFESSGAARHAHIHITMDTPGRGTLLQMLGWFMKAPSHEDGDTEILQDRRPSDSPFYRVGAVFAAPDDEHYYGAGQNQEGWLDHRGHEVRCWSDYDAVGGESWCVPLLVTNRGYGVLWDNPSKTTIEPGFNEVTTWSSQVGDRVSYFVIVGASTDDIYAGYRLLTGAAPLLPKGAYGFIQSKNRYSSQAEVLSVAKGYRERHLPADVLVVDWFYYTKMGQMDFDPRYWPDPAAMNRELHSMGFQTMISVWPRFAPGSRYYDLLLKNGWFIHQADGTPTTTNGLPDNRTGANIDTTNPAAAKWFWHAIDQNLISKGFSAIWTDETEPDIPPNGSYLYIGPGTQYFNVYPLFETAAVYHGMRRDMKTRALILARAAYTGAQRNGTIFWSSDISPTWDALRRQIPTGLDVTASGLPYWCNDVGGFDKLPAVHHPAHPPLIDPSDARDNVGDYDDYPELYVRWFQYGSFGSIFRTHGTRTYNEIWSYGRQAEPILEKYLRLRYAVMPYIYSMAYRAYQTGAPYMRALFMDFPNDPNVDGIGDEYMFGPAFLVAPVTSQGMTTKQVYLPTGTDWYNYWTHELYRGGQTITAAAAIDTLPLFVRAGSIIPMGSAIESTQQKQTIVKIQVWPGADASFTLYRDDGKTYGYEKGSFELTHLHWSDATQTLTRSGAAAWSGPDSEILEIIDSAGASSTTRYVPDENRLAMR